MRKISEIIVHCTATPPQSNIGVKEIRNHHTAVNGWKDIGYHYVVRLNGEIENGRCLHEQGAHCAGHNAHSIGVAYVGGIDTSGAPADTRTPSQKTSLKQLLQKLKDRFPEARIHGHRDFAAKACPSFNATAEYASISSAPAILLAASLFFSGCASSRSVVSQTSHSETSEVRHCINAVSDSVGLAMELTFDSLKIIPVNIHRGSTRLVAHGVKAVVAHAKKSSAFAVMEDSVMAKEHVVATEHNQKTVGSNLPLPLKKFALFLALPVVAAVAFIWRKVRKAVSVRR